MRILVSGAALFCLGLMVSCAEKSTKDSGSAFGGMVQVPPLREQIRSEIREKVVPKARACYEAALKKGPSEGKIVMNVNVAQTGKVMASTVKEAAMVPKSPQFEQCMNNAFLTTQFSPLNVDNQALGGNDIIVEVDYPFAFQSKAKK